MPIGNKGGRPRKPIELHQRDGTYRSDRMGARKEPPYPPGLPPAPTHLSAAARLKYKDLGKLMLDARVLTEADAGLLALYAESWANWAHASRMEQRERKRREEYHAMWDANEHDSDMTQLEKRLRLLEDSPRESPWYRRSLEERKMVDKLGSMLGLSPVMRTKVAPAAEPEKPKAGMAEFLA